MVNLITGPKGTGKTQQMIELANEKVKTSNGNVVFIKKSHRNTTTLDFGVRAICMEDYPDILTMDEFIMLEGADDIFDVSVVDFIDIIRYNVGVTVTVEYKEGERANSVLSLNGEEPDQKAKETKKSEAESEEQALSEE